MLDPLLTTKFYAPPARPGLVSRPRLLQKMDAGLRAGARLTLITAPAGYGKTTLALDWLQRLGRPYGWISLDREDNHPTRFMNYLIAALGQLDDSLQQACRAFPSAPGGEGEADWVSARLKDLINLLASRPEPLALALDDYHVITDLGIHEALGFFLEHQPPQLHLVITSRQDPLLPLSKLRSRGLLTEVRLGELRFTRSETDAFLNETMQLDLLPDQVAALEARTEGWIAGLQLAALSLSELPAVTLPDEEAGLRARYIQAFAGDDRHIVDYLMDEVLSRQPEEVQRFLLHTCVLKRLSGPLCAAVLDEPEPGGASQQILEALERANLFVIPLDNRRQWYRYHHLFAELLLSRLQATGPGQVALLHQRASRWYEQAGLTGEAVDHALLAEDFERALALIDRVAQVSIWTSGDLPVLLNWSKRLPEDVLMTRPRLCLYYARALFFAGQVEPAESFLERAELSLRARPEVDPAGELWGVLYTNQATVRAMLGDYEAALGLARLAEEQVPASDASCQARIAHAIGVAELGRGLVLPAERAFARAVRLARQVENRNLGLDAVSCLALAQRQAGRLQAAADLCRQTLDHPLDRQAPPAGAVYLALAQVQADRYELEPALASLETAGELARKAGWLHVLWQVHWLQAQVHQALDDPDQALASLTQAEAVVRRYPVARLPGLVGAQRARFELVYGSLAAAGRWANELESAGPFAGQRDFEDLTWALVRQTEGEPELALARVAAVLASAGPAGRTASRLEALLRQARLLDQLGQPAAAHQALLQALDLAEPAGFVRVFLDPAPDRSLAGQLAQVRQAPASPAALRQAGRLLAILEAHGIAPQPAVPPAAPGLVEPLSERELEVLHLLAEGLSNPEIAARLYLSVNTLRAHAANIYQKLDVHSRLQAVARARELGLLP